MRKMKKTKKSAIIAGCLAGVLAIAGAFAFLTDYDSAENRFSFLGENGEQTIDINLVEPGWDEALTVDADEDGIPDGDKNENGIPDFAENVIYGTPVDKAPYVENLGENGVYTFVTVLVPTKEVITSDDYGVWGEKTSKELYTIHQLNADNEWIEIGKNAVGEWAAVGNQASDGKAILSEDGKFTAHVFAYKGILEPGERTSDLFKQVEMINLVNGQIDADDPATTDVNEATNLNIYVNAYAVQSDGQESTDAVALWKVMMNETSGVNGGDPFNVFSPLAD